MEQQTHKRRVRYKGTHPRTYQEKYKELNPEKYKDTIEHVIQKGNTPAGMHISICVKEILDFLQIRPGQTGLDATLGYGGHSTEMLKCLEGRGHLYALDVDPIEIEKTKSRLAERGFAEDILSIKQMNFANVKELLPESGKFDFVLADLGVSSMQIDNPERGFSYKFDGPLDLRLDPQKGVPASERLREMSRDEIAGMLIENADEPYAEEIAKAISMNADIIIMDEPTSALDPVSTLKIEELMNTLKEKYTVAIVTHNMQQATRISDYTAFFLVGEMVEYAPTDELFSRPADKRTEDYITGRFG